MEASWKKSSSDQFEAVSNPYSQIELELANLTFEHMAGVQSSSLINATSIVSHQNYHHIMEEELFPRLC